MNLQKELQLFIDIGVRRFKFKFGFVILFLSLFFSNSTFSQTNDSTYHNYLLNNNVPKRTYRTGLTKSILKTNLIQLLDGEFQTIWEHRFNDLFGFDVGPGLIMPYTFNKFEGLNAETDETDGFMKKTSNIFLFHLASFENKKFGFSFQLEPKLYFNSKTRFLTTDHSNSLGPFYHFRSYSSLMINEIGLAYTNIPGFSKLSYTQSIAFSYTIQTPFNNESDLKFIGKPTSTLNRHGLPNYTSFRIYVRMDLGLFIN